MFAGAVQVVSRLVGPLRPWVEGALRWLLARVSGGSAATSPGATSPALAGETGVAKPGPVEAASVTVDPVGVEPVKAEPVEAEPVKAEPVKGAEPVKAEPVQVEPVEAKQAKADDPSPMTTAAFLTGAITLVGGALAVISLTDADVDRAVLQAREWVIVAFVFLVAAICLGSAMALVPERRRSLAGGAGLFCLAMGLIVLASATVFGKTSKDRPRIEAGLQRLSDGLHVKGKVTAEGVRADEHVLVRVIGISTRNRLAEAHLGHQRGNEPVAPCPPEEQDDAEQVKRVANVDAPAKCWRQLAGSMRVGARPDGSFEAAIDTPLAAGLYERVDVEARLISDDEDEEEPALAEPRCDKRNRNFGCVTIMLPPGARRPELDARWELPASSPPVLAVTARMGDLSVDDRVLLSVRRVQPGGKLSRIYGASWAPGASGEVNQQLRIPVAARNRPVCVILRALRGSLEPRGELKEAFGPCTPRSQGMAVMLHQPPRARGSS